jgi:hypothetical protein
MVAGPTPRGDRLTRISGAAGSRRASSPMPPACRTAAGPGSRRVRKANPARVRSGVCVEHAVAFALQGAVPRPIGRGHLLADSRRQQLRAAPIVIVDWHHRFVQCSMEIGKPRRAPSPHLQQRPFDVMPLLHPRSAAVKADRSRVGVRSATDSTRHRSGIRISRLRRKRPVASPPVGSRPGRGREAERGADAGSPSGAAGAGLD